MRSSYLWPNGYNDSINETWNLQMTKLKMFSFEICLWTGFQRLCAHHISLAIKFSFNHIWELVTLKGSCRRNQTLNLDQLSRTVWKRARFQAVSLLSRINLLSDPNGGTDLEHSLRKVCSYKPPPLQFDLNHIQCSYCNASLQCNAPIWDLNFMFEITTCQ